MMMRCLLCWRWCAGTGHVVLPPPQPLTMPGGPGPLYLGPRAWEASGSPANCFQAQQYGTQQWQKPAQRTAKPPEQAAELCVCLPHTTSTHSSWLDRGVGVSAQSAGDLSTNRRVPAPRQVLTCTTSLDALGFTATSGCKAGFCFSSKGIRKKSP